MFLLYFLYNSPTHSLQQGFHSTALRKRQHLDKALSSADIHVYALKRVQNLGMVFFFFFFSFIFFSGVCVCVCWQRKIMKIFRNSVAV